jgi:uncharacterized protein
MRDKKFEFRAYDIDHHLIVSEVVAETFSIKIAQPMRRADGSERFPVVYATDSDHFFGGLSNLSALMQGYGETPRFLLVGIGYQNSGAAAVLRMRDLYSRRIHSLLAAYIAQVAESDFVTGLDDVRRVTQTTDAGHFLRFIREELMPWVDAHYPVAPNDNSYWGYSAGGAFGLFTLFNEPQTFKRYVLGSPGVSYKGQNFGMELAESFVKSQRRADARVFMSVGELEEYHPASSNFDLVTGYVQLSKFMKQSPVAGLELTARVFPGETHATAWTSAFTHGLRAVFGSAGKVPFWPDTLS